MKTRDYAPRSAVKVPRTRSPLAAAYRVGLKASQSGFDWPDIEGVFDKIEEELAEIREAVAAKEKRKILEEMGDLLFVLVNLARFLQIDPDEALRRGVKKFVTRFGHVEKSLREKGRSFDQCDLAEMDRLWEEAKRRETK